MSGSRQQIVEAVRDNRQPMIQSAPVEIEVPEESIYAPRLRLSGYRKKTQNKHEYSAQSTQRMFVRMTPWLPGCF